MNQYRVTFDYDPDPDFSYLEQWDTAEKYEGNEIHENGRPLSFDEYMASGFGDPEQHVAIVADVEMQCECCNSWVHKASLGNIDFLLTDNDWTTGTFTQAEIEAGAVKGYLADVAKELFSEASEVAS